MANKLPFLSIVFPLLNEETVLPELIRRLRAVMADLEAKNILRGHEFIFGDDASTDNSVQVLKDLDAGHNDIRIVTMSRRFGISPSIMAGLSYACGDACVFMEADLQDQPELVPEMVRAWQDGADVVHTVRRSRKGESPFKLFVTKIGYFILNRYSSIPLPSEAGDFKLLSRRAVKELLLLKEHRPYVRGLACWIGFKQAFVYYGRDARFSGQSKYFVLSKRVIDNFFNSALINFSSVPLKIASYCGLAAILVDFGIMIVALVSKINGQTVPGWTALMIAVLFLGGVQLFCIGMIGVYLNAVHEQTKSRPNYIVESTYGFKNSASN